MNKLPCPQCGISLRRHKPRREGSIFTRNVRLYCPKCGTPLILDASQLKSKLKVPFFLILPAMIVTTGFLKGGLHATDGQLEAALAALALISCAAVAFVVMRYFRYVPSEAQPGAPADPPRPAGSAGG
jgi:predicted RNA-binding Zn-ribbon protein involved in translation (DUF1610 family)